MKTIALSTCQSTRNVGDIASSPMLYFDYPEVEHWDSKVGQFGHPPEFAGAYIFGGGAITTRIHSMVSPLKLDGPKIAWGLGQNKKAGEQYVRSTPLSDFDRDRNFFCLIGTRDINIAGAEWVPCASCMSPLFDKEYEIKHDTLVYLNSPKEYSGKCFGNRGSFEDSIKFIASGSTILTDSYHGAYWATLLGRTAVIIHPYGSKFYQYKHQPVIVRPERGTMTEPRVFPEALAECRAANIQFDAKVREVMGL